MPYTLTLQNIAGAETDIVAARFYLNGGPPIEVPALPNQAFTATATWPDSGPVAVECSLVDSAGNESTRRLDNLVVPDHAAPTAPGTATRLIAAVWTAD